MHPAGAYADSLLAALPAVGAEPTAARLEHPALAWARSGAMLLTGRADEPPRLAPAPLATCAAAALDALRALAPKSRLALEAAGAGARGLDGAALLGERAAYLGLSRRGAISPGGSCRLLRAADGWIAVSLPRDEDRALIPAWLEGGEGSPSDPWDMRRVPRCAAARRRGRRARPPARPRRVGGRRPRRRRAALAACGRARRAPRRRARALRAARARSLGALGGAALRPAARARRSPRGEGRKRGSPGWRPLRAARLLRSPEHRQGEPCPRSPDASGRRAAFAAFSSARTP